MITFSSSDLSSATVNVVVKRIAEKYNLNTIDLQAQENDHDLNPDTLLISLVEDSSKEKVYVDLAINGSSYTYAIIIDNVLTSIPLLPSLRSSTTISSLISLVPAFKNKQVKVELEGFEVSPDSLLDSHPSGSLKFITRQ
jgi:hypothetical protein